MVVAASDANQMTVHKNNGSGSAWPASSYGVGAEPCGVVLGDIDGDGDLDAIVANRAGDTITVLRNNGTGAYSQAETYTPGDEPRSVALGDIDGDDDLDVVVVCKGPHAAIVYENDGAGVLSVLTMFTPGDQPISVAMGDLDGDQDTDIIVGCDRGKRVVVFENNLDDEELPPFTLLSSYILTFDPVSAIALGDIDGDGDLDAALATGASRLHVLRNTGVGDFELWRDVHEDYTTFSGVALADVDGDSDIDLIGSAITTEFGHGLVICRQQPDHSLSEPEFMLAGTINSGVVVVDIDADGDADIVTSNYAGDYITCVSNFGNGNFGVRLAAGLVPDNTTGLALGDIDGDLDLDAIAVGDFTGWSLVPNNGSMDFGPTIITEPPNRHYSAVELVDIDGDGDSDALMTDRGADLLLHFDNLGGGLFTLHATYPTGVIPIGLACGDLDADGDADIVVVNDGDSAHLLDAGSLTVFTNNGLGSLSPTATYTGLFGPTSVAIGDLDGDEQPDVVAIEAGRGNLLRYLNDGTGALEAPESFTVGSLPHAIVLADLDGDGDLDAVVSTTGTLARVHILINDDYGALEYARSVPATPHQLSIDAADIDEDGDIDLVVPGAQANNVALLRNNGNATFARLFFASNTEPTSARFGDMDGDSDVDIVVAGRVGIGSGLTVLPNLTRRQQTLCPADIDGDAFATAHDFVILALHFGALVPPGTSGDLNNDGLVNSADFVIFAAEFGRACP